jgi:hypothetical protein
MQVCYEFGLIIYKKENLLYLHNISCCVNLINNSQDLNCLAGDVLHDCVSKYLMQDTITSSGVISILKHIVSCFPVASFKKLWALHILQFWMDIRYRNIISHHMYSWCVIDVFQDENIL